MYHKWVEASNHSGCNISFNCLGKTFDLTNQISPKHNYSNILTQTCSIKDLQRICVCNQSDKLRFFYDATQETNVEPC